MFFSSLRTTAFRNLADTEIFTGAKDVFLIGENGQGKTNFLEALYFCAYGSSFRTIKDSELARNSLSETEQVINGGKTFSAEVKLAQSVNDELLVKFEKNKKSVFINKKRAEDRKELLSIAPTIVFCHEDMDFVTGSPERRRWFFDQTLSLYDPVYLDDLRRYRRILKSRNTLLRDHAQKKCVDDPELILDALDPQLAAYGQNLMEKRRIAAQEFSDVFCALYGEVSGISGINVQYIQSWKSTNEDDILIHLKHRRAADMAAGLSLTGPHRDRYLFAHNKSVSYLSQDNILQNNASNNNMTDFTITASTGQKRLLALLLRAAQARRFSAVTGQNPILLLDDVLLEMDGEKRRRFISVLPAYDQAFYTFLPDEPYQRYQKEDTLVYWVKDGKVEKE